MSEVQKVTESDLLDEERVTYAAEMLKLMGHPVRLQIVALLERAGELPAGSFHEVLDKPQPTVSQHLNRMRALGLLKTRKQGGEILYSVGQPQLLQLLHCVRECKV